MDKSARIYIAGHRGLVGTAITAELQRHGYRNLLLRTSAELDLRRQADVDLFFAAERPEYVVLAAAKVGGIIANSTWKADFIYDNILIASNIIKASAESGVKKLLNLGSSCIYPKLAPQPLTEDSLLTGLLEPSNEPYAIAKIAAIKMCNAFNDQYGTNFISAMPTNLYGPNDNFDLTSSHVLPAMIRKFHEARTVGGTVDLWGDGSPMREFLYSADLAEGLVFLLENIDAVDMPIGFLNIGSGKDLSIRELADIVAQVVGYDGQIHWDSSKPNGTPRKVMDVGAINDLGWHARTSLKDGISRTYDWFLEYLA